MSWRYSRGVTALELIIVLVLLGVIMAIALPSVATLMANQRIKSTAESLRSGLQLARMEALKRGRIVAFSMADPSSLWFVGCETPVNDDDDGDGMPDCPRTIISGERIGDSGNISIATNGSMMAAFSPIGLVRQFNQDGSAPFTQIDVTVTGASGGITPLRVLLPAGGLSRVCDPSITAVGDTRKC